VFDVRRYSIHDGPGIRTAVFLKGCPLSCLWCHNPEGQAPGFELMHRESRCIRCGACVQTCRQDAIAWTDDGPVTDRSRCAACGECEDACVADARQRVGRRVTVEEVVAEVERDRPFYEESGGGVTLTGGEPLFQDAFAAALLEALTLRGIHTALDTCGAASWHAFERVRSHVDLFLYDVKLVDEERHRRFTGASNRLVLANLNALVTLGHRVRLRVPIIPGYTDDDANLKDIADLAASLPRLDGIDLLPYHAAGAEKYGRLGRAYALDERGAPTAERLRRAAEILADRGLPVAGAAAA
jgi:pyruvate formate lyase activating enzyme